MGMEIKNFGSRLWHNFGAQGVKLKALHKVFQNYFFDPGRRFYCIRVAFFYKAGLITG